MATQKWLIGLLTVACAGAPACASGAGKTTQDQSSASSDSSDNGDNGDDSSKDAAAATTKRPDSGSGAATVHLDAGTKQDAAKATPAPSDAGPAPSDDVPSSSPSDGPSTSVPTGTLPAVTDLGAAGPFTTASGPGPSGFVLFYPKELGKGGVKHPILSFGPGAAENAGSFTTLLTHFASHGFAVISYDGTPDGQELITAIDYMVAENARSDSMFYQKLDISKIGAGGHSAGSLATFKVAAEKRLITTVHLSGGTFDPHTDINNLHAPALFICGDDGGDGLITGDVARPNCDLDFMNAKVPVFYGDLIGAAHMSPTEIGDPVFRTKIAAACVGWLRWQLAGDETQKPTFVGSDCTLCKDSAWKSQQKNW